MSMRGYPYIVGESFSANGQVGVRDQVAQDDLLL